MFEGRIVCALRRLAGTKTLVTLGMLVLVGWVGCDLTAGDPEIGMVVQNAKGGDECGGGVHLCNVVDAYKKCGVSKKKGKPIWNADDPKRNAMCCCHSDTCPEACCEGALTSTGQIDAAMTIDASGNVVILDQALYDQINADIRSCYIRGDLGGIDMVPKCARVDSQTGAPRCPTSGATQDVPAGEVCTAGVCDGFNDYLGAECLCEEDPVQ